MMLFWRRAAEILFQVSFLTNERFARACLLVHLILELSIESAAQVHLFPCFPVSSSVCCWECSLYVNYLDLIADDLIRSRISYFFTSIVGLVVTVTNH